jgi:hypothetical protein
MKGKLLHQLQKPRRSRLFCPPFIFVLCQIDCPLLLNYVFWLSWMPEVNSLVPEPLVALQSSAFILLSTVYFAVKHVEQLFSCSRQQFDVRIDAKVLITMWQLQIPLKCWLLAAVDLVNELIPKKHNFSCLKPSGSYMVNRSKWQVMTLLNQQNLVVVLTRTA